MWFISEYTEIWDWGREGDFTCTYMYSTVGSRYGSELHLGKGSQNTIREETRRQKAGSVPRTYYK